MYNAIIKLLFLIFINTFNILARNPCSSFGDYSYHQSHITVQHWNNPNVHYQVGKFCSIANNVTIFLGGNHRTDWVSTFPLAAFFPEVSYLVPFEMTKGDVIIGNDVWIGEEVKILSGVTIGDGAIIGAFSVVAKSIPAYAIAVGNPARIVRYRFDEDIIKALLAIQWWHWPIEKIKQNAHLICNSDPTLLIQLHLPTSPQQQL